MTEYQNEFMRGDGAGLSYNSLWYALQMVQKRIRLNLSTLKHH